MRRMYDAVTWANIPAGAEMVAGYPGGLYAWPAEAWDRFTGAVKVRVAVSAAEHSSPGARFHVLDVENGDATPGQAPGWCAEERRLGEDPSVYCNASTWPQVRAAFAAARVPGPHWWIADYDGVASVPAGAVAKQYQGGPTSAYDVSAVADYWPGVDPAPEPEPKPKPPVTEETMPQLLAQTTDAQPIALPDNAKSVRFFTNSGTPVVFHVDTRSQLAKDKGSNWVEVSTSYDDAGKVDVPAGISGFVVHRSEAALLISYAVSIG